MIESSSDVDKTTPSVESKSRKFSIMASQVGGGDDDPGPSVKRSRLAFLAVHEEFVVHDVHHQKKNQQIQGRRCKTCNTVLFSTNSSNLKKHLQGIGIFLFFSFKMRNLMS